MKHRKSIMSSNGIFHDFEIINKHIYYTCIRAVGHQSDLNISTNKINCKNCLKRIASRN